MLPDRRVHYKMENRIQNAIFQPRLAQVMYKLEGTDKAKMLLAKSLDITKKSCRKANPEKSQEIDIAECRTLELYIWKG